MSINRRRFCAALPAALACAAHPAHAYQPRLGLIFVAQSTCPYCAAIAPVLGQLEAETGIDVLVAAMDRRPIPPFTQFQDGTIHPLTAHFRTVPQVLVFNGHHQRITHHIAGVRTMRDFVSRLSLALQQSTAL